MVVVPKLTEIATSIWIGPEQLNSKLKVAKRHRSFCSPKPDESEARSAQFQSPQKTVQHRPIEVPQQGTLSFHTDTLDCWTRNHVL